jgi:hypothetical protein
MVWQFKRENIGFRSMAAQDSNRLVVYLAGLHNSQFKGERSFQKNIVVFESGKAKLQELQRTREESLITLGIIRMQV